MTWYTSVLLPGVEQAVGQGGRMPLQISMQGGENMSLASHFSRASLHGGPTEIRWKLTNLSAGQHSAYG